MTTEDYRHIVDELVEMIDEGVYIVDNEGTGIHYNSKMADTEKVNYEDVKGKKFHEAFPDFDMGSSTIYKALKDDKTTEKHQQTYKNLYGKEITTVNSTHPVIVGGKTVAAIEVSKDITDIKKMSDTLLSLRENLAEEAEKGTKNPDVSYGKARIKKYSFEDIYGENPDFITVVERAKKAALNNAAVFIYGETGTGKELFAQAIHYAGSRAKMPFLAQNCAAIPETLLEGILFGTTKGAFTGAVDRAGLFEQANGGTLLLDEVSAMPYDLQSKLLRVLQEGYIRRIGGQKDIPIDVRIIATVNEPADKLMEQGSLRKDLYFRLNVVNISIPSLRDRLSDIPKLTDIFLEKYNQKFGKEVWMVSDSAIKKLQSYEYPGNVRELENIIESAISMADKEHVLTEKHLQLPNARKLQRESQSYDMTQPLDDYLAALEKRIIQSVMTDAKGNISKAAETLGIKRQTLQHKLKKYEINAK